MKVGELVLELLLGLRHVCAGVELVGKRDAVGGQCLAEYEAHAFFALVGL